MERRDKGLPGRRAGRRDHMPAFLQSDDDEVVDGAGGLLSGVNVRRRRRQYDERMDEDDVEEEDVSVTLLRVDNMRYRAHTDTLGDVT
jgi:DNA replication licensing factor MCM2